MKQHESEENKMNQNRTERVRTKQNESECLRLTLAVQATAVHSKAKQLRCHHAIHLPLAACDGTSSP